MDRRGKYLLVGLDDGRELVVHLGMTGSLAHRPASTSPHAGRTAADPYLRASWALDDDRTLLFRDIRRFGRLAVVPAGDYRALPTLHQLGPEPFDAAFTPARCGWRCGRAAPG